MAYIWDVYGEQNAYIDKFNVYNTKPFCLHASLVEPLVGEVKPFYG